MDNKQIMNNSSSYLELIVGPMFSGKTSKLLEIYKQCNFCNIPVVIINYDLDKRYHETMISSHDKIMAPCIQANELMDIWKSDTNKDKYEQILKSDVILINEGQFFVDLCEVVVEMLKLNKKIYIAGLDGDFERKKFGEMLDLIPLCDKITKLHSLCGICKNGTPGIFSKRIVKEKTQTLVGVDNYIPVCRKCF